VPQITIPYSRVAITLAEDAPYFAADEIGLTELWKLHPEADGRGVTVAVFDEGFDLLHPALQQARDAEGQIVPKIVDLATLTSPEEDNGWVRFQEPIQTQNGTFEAAGRIWTAPKDGLYRFGIFQQNLALGPEGNSQTRKLSLSVGVLWDQSKGHVWVDTDGDRSFKSERALGDYAVTHDIAWFGMKTGDRDDRIPFGVKIDAAQNAVYIRIGGQHGAMVGGPLAGNKLTGGLFDGAAPSAQLIDASISYATLIAGIVNMFARADVDVVNRSGGVGRVGYTGAEEGFEDFARHVLERVTSVYNKPMACACDANGALNVGDYTDSEMLRRNRQLEPPYRDTINPGIPFISNGLVNKVYAPSANLETDSRYQPDDITWEDRKRHSFDDNHFDPPAPNGYMIGSNPSPTIPVVSGVLADLISQAKRQNVRYSVDRLNEAVFTGTRLLDGFPLSQQGRGLINAAQSWAQLEKMAKADDLKNPKLTSFTISQTDGGKSVEVQGFHTDLVKSAPIEEELWVTRRGGYAGGRKYSFALRGNDGSVTLLDTKGTLVRDLPARIRFESNGAPGRHVVFLELRDAQADVVMQDVPLSVRAPDAPEQVAPGVDKYESTIAPLRSESRFPYVGEDVQAARYLMTIPYTGPENISTRAFPGFRYWVKTTHPGEAVDPAHHVGPLETLESLVVNDEPGMQQIFWENRGRPEYATRYDGPAPDVPIHATLIVTKYAVAIAKIEAQTLSVTNQLADVEGHVELFDAKLASLELKSVGNHAMAEASRDVPAGLAQWRLRVTGPARGADAYLFNCTGKNGCYVVMQHEITDKGALLVVDKPQAGTWKIIIRSRKQVVEASVYKLSEAELMPTQTRTMEADTKHSSGEKWTVALPSTSQYAAFRIAGTPGNEREKDGLLIAMTPLDTTAP
jgi:hypothetical protein